MSSSASSQFGSRPVGSSVQPCPLGQIHVDVLRSDGAPPDEAVKVTLTGPDSEAGTVAAGAGTWTSPKIRPGTYLVQAAPDARGGYQPVQPVSCELPESGVATARIALEPYASVVIGVTREQTGDPVAGVTVRLTGGGGTVEVPTSGDGTAAFDRLITSDPFRLELELGDRAGAFAPFEPRSVALRPGANDRLVVELAPMAELEVAAVATEGGARRELPIRATLTPAEGPAVETETDRTTGKTGFSGLVAGDYQVAAEPAQESDRYYAVAPLQVSLSRGERRRVELTATREQSRIVMSDRAGQSSGLLRDLLLASYPESRDQVRGVPVQSAALTLPFPELGFDDVPFEAEQVYTDDGLEAIVVMGRVEACGQSRELLFARTYRPVRTVLALKLREWRFDREWGVFHWGELARHCVLSSGFLTLSASETSLKSADLPPGVQSFLGDEKLDLKQGINLYGKLDVETFPALRTLLGWMGVSETYLKIQGYLARDANLVFSKEAREKRQPQEKVWDLALSASIPAPTVRWPPGMIKEREITLEIGAKREQKGRSPFVGRILDRASGAKTGSGGQPPAGSSSGSSASAGSAAAPSPETGPATPPKTDPSHLADKPELEPPSESELNAAPKTEPEKNWETEVKLRVKVEDAITMPFVHFVRPWLASSLNQDDDEIEFSGAFQVEAGLEQLGKKAKLGESEVTLEYGTSFKLNVISDEVAALHDLKVELNATKHTLKLAGALDLGRREKVAAVEIQRPLPGSRPAAARPASAGSEPPAEPGSGDAKTDTKADAKADTKKKRWWDDCDVTVKVKPGLALGVLDVIKEANAALEARRRGAS